MLCDDFTSLGCNRQKALPQASKSKEENYEQGEVKELCSRSIYNAKFYVNRFVVNLGSHR